MLHPYDFSIRQIDSATADELEKLLNSLALKGKDTCTLEITCKDGEVVDALRMMQIIRGSPVGRNATVVGEVGSMATVVLQCCKTRRMTSNATLHFHYGHWRVSFLVYSDEEMAIRNRQQGIEYQQALVEPIALRAGMSDEEVHRLMREDEHLGAKEALALSLIDEIAQLTAQGHFLYSLGKLEELSSPMWTLASGMILAEYLPLACNVPVDLQVGRSS